MCLIAVAYRTHPHYALVVAANRDEFHARPAAAAHFWPEKPHVLAGRDLQGQGTWLGVTRGGRLAALTNFRAPDAQRPDAPTRGRLVVDALEHPGPATAYLDRLLADSERFNAFNLFVFDGQEAHAYASRTRERQTLAPGLWSISNGGLREPWPKTTRLEAALAAVMPDPELDPEPLLAALRDTRSPADHELPDTGVGLAMERRLGSVFIQSPSYGTRCSTVVMVGHDGSVRLIERSYDHEGRPSGQVDWSLPAP